MSNQLALDWIVSCDTGSSSITIWSVMMGAANARPSHPYDPADFGRCLRLLELIPEWKTRMHLMREMGPKWCALVDHWDELKTSMENEVGIDWSKGQKAPITYEAMEKVLTP